MTESSWIESEISYSLKKIPREGTTSQRNGLVAVIKKVNDSYDWFKYTYKGVDGHIINGYHEEKIFKLICQNRGNQDPQKYCCDKCKSIDPLTGSYISYVEEDEFLANIDIYINNAFDKAQNDCQGYIVKPIV